MPDPSMSRLGDSFAGLPYKEQMTGGAIQAPQRTPGTPYEGSCVNCGRTIRAAFFIDWQSVEPPQEINVRCGCGYGNLTVTLYRVPATVMAVN